jgi:pyridoxine 4-dehydrogenase
VSSSAVETQEDVVTDRPVAGSGELRIGDMTVHRLGFGTMQLTGPGVWGPPRDHDAAIAVLRRVVDLGVDLLDTADSYGPGVAEDLIHEALHPYPTGLRIATKAGLARTGPDQWVPVGRPAYLRQQCEMSLRRLDVERIDLFQLHRIDPDVPAAEQIGVLKDLRDEGKIAEVGLSEVQVADVEAARAITPIVTVQNLFNLGNQGADDLLAYCETAGIGFIPWFPLASGRLAQPGGPVDDVARQLDVSVAQVALAWLLRRSPVLLPIPGTSSVAHAEDNCAAAGLELTDAQYNELTEARRPLRRWARG